jgi:hypothetical protein
MQTNLEKSKRKGKKKMIKERKPLKLSKVFSADVVSET